jgi:pimeloyl-ACP methyl ester carboxylesterase
MTSASPGRPTAYFLHGLESTSRGTKGRWFAEHFPAMRMRDYHGDLAERLDQLTEQVDGVDDLVLVGSSFGALMATCFAVRHPQRCRRLVLLAPALNYAGYRPPGEAVDVDTVVVVGESDTVCPAAQVLPLARRTFTRLEVMVVADDHLLHRTFPRLDWTSLLSV